MYGTEVVTGDAASPCTRRRNRGTVASMFVDIVPNRQSPPAILLRESWREGRGTRKRTLANLSHRPAQKVEQLRRVLRDEPLVAPDALFTVERSIPHGHVEAVRQMMHRLQLDTMLTAKRSRERDLVLALIVERLLHPASNLATTRLWSTTTLGETLGVVAASFASCVLVQTCTIVRLMSSTI
jgi:hypothetical protein